MLTRSTLLSSTTSTSRRRLHCSLPLAGDRTDPEILAGLLPSRRDTETRMLSLGQDIRRWHQPRREFRTRITGGACRGVRAQKVRRRRGDRALGILGVGEGSRRRTAPSPRSGWGRAGSLARSGTCRIRECGPARATATAPSRIEAISIQLAEFASAGPECGPAFAAAAGRRSNRRVDRAYRARESAKARSVGG